MNRSSALSMIALLLVLLGALSCEFLPNGSIDKGSGVPESFTQKALLEMASCTANLESEVAEEIASRLTSGTDRYRDAVYAAAFHIDDPLTLNPPKSSELMELRNSYIDAVLASIGEIPVAAISRRPLDDAFYSIFIGCSRWEEELDNLFPQGVDMPKSCYGLKIETAMDESTISASVYVGFAEEPWTNFFVTVFIVEDGIEVFRKGTGYSTYNSVVRGLMMPPSGRHCPFGFPVYSSTVDAGEYVKLEFILTLDADIVFNEKDNLKILAVLHESWCRDEEGSMIPGPVINVQQVKPGDFAGWD